MNKKRNSGYYNTKDKNTGNRNIGDFNTGHCNTGDWNTGDFNTGSCNTGNWNTGNYNTGYLNTGIPKITIFNKETDLSMQDIVFPEYFYRVNSLQWTYYQDMTSKEKKDNPDAEIVGGYLKKYTYHEAWRNAWDSATDEDRKLTLKLPNWDNEIFKEITGIDVEKELSQEESCKHESCEGYKYCPHCGEKL